MDFSQFFVPTEQLTPDSGFKPFGCFHLCCLCVIVLITALCSRWHCRQSDAIRVRFLKFLSILIVVQEIVKDIIIVLIDSPLIQYLPLHLCGLAIFFLFAAAFHPTPFVYELLYSLTLPGAAAALLFPNWTECPPIHFLCLHSFTFHAYLVIFVCVLLSSGQLRPNFKRLGRCFAFLIAASVPVYCFNKWANTNYLFLNVPSEGSPLVPLEKLFGNPGYIGAAAVLLLPVWLIIYLPWSLPKHKSMSKTQ